MGKYKAYFAIEAKLHKRGHPVDRAMLVELFTDGEHESLSKLDSDRYKAFIEWLNNNFKEQLGDPALEKMQRKALHYLKHEMKWTKEMIDAWCIKYSPFHKVFDKHTTTEINKLLAIIENKVYPNYMKKLLND